MAIYEDFLAEQAEELAKETEDREGEVRDYELQQLVTGELERAVSHLHHYTSLIGTLTKLYRTTMMKPILPPSDPLPTTKTLPLWTRKP